MIAGLNKIKKLKKLNTRKPLMVKFGVQHIYFQREIYQSANRFKKKMPGKATL